MWKKDQVYFFQPREPVFDSNTIIIKDENIILIDPGTESKEYFKEILDELNLDLNDVDLVFNTHSHYDHFQGNKYFPEADKMAFEPDAGKISRKTDEEITRIREEEKLSTGELTFKIIHTPGHSKGSCSLHLPGEILICGDLVFANGSYGRVDLEGGFLKDLKKSLEKVKDLDFKHLLPGHREIGDKEAVEKALTKIRI